MKQKEQCWGRMKMLEKERIKEGSEGWEVQKVGRI